MAKQLITTGLMQEVTELCEMLQIQNLTATEMGKKGNGEIVKISCKWMDEAMVW